MEDKVSAYKNTISIDDMAQACGFCDVSKQRVGCNGIDKKTLVDKVQDLKGSLGAMDSENRTKTEHTIEVCESIIAGMDSGIKPFEMVKEEDIKTLSAAIRFVAQNNADLQGKSQDEVVNYFFERKNAKGDIKNVRAIFSESEVKELITSPEKDDSANYYRVDPFPKRMVELLAGSSYASDNIKASRRALVDELLKDYSTNSFKELAENIQDISKSATQTRQANASRKALDDATGSAKEIIDKIGLDYQDVLVNTEAFNAFFALFKYPEILKIEKMGDEDISTGVFFTKADNIRNYLGINLNDAIQILAKVLPFFGYGVVEEIAKGDFFSSSGSNSSEANPFKWGKFNEFSSKEIEDCIKKLKERQYFDPFLAYCGIIQNNLLILEKGLPEVSSNDFKKYFVLRCGTDEIFNRALDIFGEIDRLEPKGNEYYNQNDSPELWDYYQKFKRLVPILQRYDTYSENLKLHPIIWKLRMVNWGDKLMKLWLAGSAILAVIYIFR